METKFDFSSENISTPIAFREDFNQFARLSQTQAWSMFFTASREDNALGLGKAVGRFWTGLLIAAIVESILGVTIFQIF
jgi:hypothetical protein